MSDCALAKENQILSKKEKLAYAMPGFTLSLSSQVAAYYLLFFFINVASIPRNLEWVILLACSLFDAFSDAFSGFYLQKKTNPKQFRSYILWTAFPLAIFSVVLFSSPSLSLAAKFIYYILAYSIWNSSLALFSIPCMSILPLITQNDAERAKLNSQRLAISVITVLLVSSATLPLVGIFGNSDMAKGFLIVMIFYAAMGLAVQLFSYKYMKLRFTNVSRPKEISVSKSIFLILKDKVTIITLLMFFFYSVANAFRNQSIMFYFTDILHKPEFVSLFFFITIGFSLLMQFVIPQLIKRVPIEIAAFFGFVGIVLSLILIFISGENIILFFIFSSLFGIFSALPANLIFLMIAKNVDKIFKKHNINLSSTVYSLLSFFAKIGAGIGLTVSAGILNLAGYSSMTETQSVSAIFGINLIHIYIPVCLFIIALIFMFSITFAHKRTKH